MNHRFTIILLAFTLLVLGGIYYLRQTVPSTRDQEELRRYALVFDPEEIHSIEITRNNESITMERTPTGWQMTSPKEDRASPEAIDQLLTSARFLEVRDRETSKDSAIATDSGLRTPRIRLLLRGNRDYRLDIGADTVLPNQIYVRTGKSNDILRVSDTILKPVSASVEELRDPRLTDLVADDIEKFTIRRADGEMTLRRDRGQWIIEKPVRSDADLRAIRAFLDPLLGLRITGFKSALTTTNTPSNVGNPTASISLTTRSGNDINFEVTRPQDAEKAPESVSAFFTPRGGALQVDASALSLFDISPELLRDRSLGYVESDTVDRIVLSSQGKTATLQRDATDDSWTLPEQDRKISKEDVENLIKTFNTSRVLAFRPSADTNKIQLEPPRESIRLFSWLSENTAEDAAGAHALAGVQLGNTNDEGKVFARHERSGEIILIEPQLSDAIRHIVIP